MPTEYFPSAGIEPGQDVPIRFLAGRRIWHTGREAPRREGAVYASSHASGWVRSPSGSVIREAPK